MPEPSFKVPGCFKKRFRQRSFSVNLVKILRTCFIERLQTFASGAAKFQAISNQFLKESVALIVSTQKSKNKKYFLVCPSARP